MAAKKKAVAKKTTEKKLPPEQSQGRTLGKAANMNPRDRMQNLGGVAENVPDGAKPATTPQTPAQPGQHPMAPDTGGGAVTTPGAQPGSHTTTETDSTTITPDRGIRQTRY